MKNKQIHQAFPEEYEIFLAELGAFMKTAKGLTDSSIRIYLNRLRWLMKNGYSAADLWGASDRLWNDFGPAGKKYDPKDHGKCRSALRHLDDYVRMHLLQNSCLYISFELGWQSSKPVEKYESGYTIQDGAITFSYDNCSPAYRNVTKKISTTDLRSLISLFESAYRKGCLAASDTCIHDIHGDHLKYSFTFSNVSGNRCAYLFGGNPLEADQLTKKYLALIEKLGTE